MLLEALKGRQGAQTDAAFAARLGIPRETWSAIKTDRVMLEGRVLLKVARRAVVEFPELRSLIEETLLPRVPGVSRDTFDDTRESAAVA